MPKLDIYFVGPVGTGKTKLIHQIHQPSFIFHDVYTHTESGRAYDSEKFRYHDATPYYLNTKKQFLKQPEFILTLPLQDEDMPNMLRSASKWIDEISTLGKSSHVCLCITKNDVKDKCGLTRITDENIKSLIAYAKTKGVDIEPELITTSAVLNVTAQLAQYLAERYAVFEDRQLAESRQRPYSQSEFELIWDRAGQDKASGQAQTIAKMLALLTDYTKGKGLRGFFNRFFTHPNRHHRSKVQEVIEQIENNAYQTHQEILNALDQKIPRETRNLRGCFHQRFEFMKQKLSQQQDESNNMSASATATPAIGL